MLVKKIKTNLEPYNQLLEAISELIDPRLDKRSKAREKLDPLNSG